LSLDTLQSDSLNLSILQQGISVTQYFLDYYSFLQFQTPLNYSFKETKLFEENKALILEYLLPIPIISTYLTYHDIGKPFCKIYELENHSKYHFPNHAKRSSELFASSHSVTAENFIISELISRDMDIHLLKAKDIKDFIGTTKYSHMIAITLLLSGFAEIHANAEMFGGIDSVSFKIKYKQIMKRGKKIIEEIRNANI